MIEVCAAFIKKDDKVLICKRPEGKNCASLWEFPGGKIEPGETAKQCIVRECMEELGIKITARRELADTVQEYPEVTVHLTLFYAEISDGTPKDYEHSEIKWINIKDLYKYEFCPADRKLLKIIDLNSL